MAKKCLKCNADNPGTAAFCADCGTQLPSLENIDVTETMETPRGELTTGANFAGRYQIIEELGKGGMGNREQAIELIRDSLAEGRDYYILHWNIDYENLEDYPPFIEMKKPKG